ncbi:hypothetical protein [Mesorhizobium sp. M0767]|uniref:hypothetical protein n=1 Tax=Mesorhizobium sp. M0767 TaxID=2956995 RepID=UPI00333B6A87
MTTDVASFEVHEAEWNPYHQGFIGFVPPKEDPMTVEKTARRIAQDLVLLPKKSRGGAYDEEYLKVTSGCRSWHKLRCAYCNCWKAP